MRSFFKSECAALFVGPAPAYIPHIYDGSSALRRLAKIQSVSYGFDINREEIKQIGHEDLLVRTINLTQAEPAPGSNIDVNIEPVPVNFTFEYLPTCGYNEYLLNFNVVPAGEEANNSFISRHFGDKNFFLVLRDDIGKEARFLQDDEDFFGHYVIGIGNAFAVGHSLSTQVGSPLRGSFDYQASNIKVDQYSGDNYIPAIHLYDGKYKEEHKYKFTYDRFGTEYDEAAILSNNIKIEVNPTNIGGVDVTKNNLNAQSFSINLDMSRRNLYGLGSMYPYDRRLQMPVRGSLNFGILKQELVTGNLNNILHEDRPYDIKIDCYGSTCISENCSEKPKTQLMTYVIDNAVLKNKSTNLQVKDYAMVDLGFDFTLTNTNGFLVSGGCLDKHFARGSNSNEPPGGRDKIGGGGISSSEEDPGGESFNPPILPSPPPTPSITPTISVSPTVTPTISLTPTITPTITPSISVSPTVTPSVTVSPTVTPSVTVSPTVTPSITITPTITPTQTPDPTQSVTPTLTPTLTPTPTITPSCLEKTLNIKFQDQSTYVVEGEDGSVAVERDWARGAINYTGAFSISYKIETEPYSAVSGIDFIGKTGRLDFTAGENAKLIEFSTIEDYVDEDTEMFKITLDEPEFIPCVNQSIVDNNPYRVLIIDDDQDYGIDQYIRFQYTSTYVLEGDKAQVTVYRDAASNSPYEPFSVHYITEEADRTAIKNLDYEHTFGELHFEKDQMSAVIEVQTLPRPGSIDVHEVSEFFNIRLYNPLSHSSNVQLVGVNPYSVFIVEPEQDQINTQIEEMAQEDNNEFNEEGEIDLPFDLNN